jgi:hypothetical protein
MRVKHARSAIAALTLLVSMMLIPTALADFDDHYCANWHSPGYYCHSTNGVYHTFDYNRSQIVDSGSIYSCQTLKTQAGNTRAGGSCATGTNAHQYSGGTPTTQAFCWFDYPGSHYLDCLASTP